MSTQQQPQYGPYENPPPYFEDSKAVPPSHQTWGGAYPPPPPQGWAPNPSSYGAVIIEQPQAYPVTQVILVGGCPSCRVGVLEDSFSCLGVLCAILFFPIGLLCCLVMREKRCTNCGASF